MCCCLCLGAESRRRCFPSSRWVALPQPGWAVGTLLLPLFVVSVVVLGYAHYRVWVRGIGHRTATLVLLANTVLVAVLWVWRLPFSS